MNLVELIHCYDGCKKLSLDAASKRLEKVINRLALELVKATGKTKTPVTENTDVTGETKQETAETEVKGS